MRVLKVCLYPQGKLSPWYSRNFLSYLLWPFSLLYRAIIFLRRACYQHGIKKITHFPVPLLIVGNITVGGTGKTPLVIWLANFLKQQGYRPGIVSRGYRSHAKAYPLLVTSTTDSHQAGDEPVLIARHTNCPVMVDPKRTRAVTKLLQDTDCNLVISDDGLQHYALARNLEIAVVDGQRYLGNEFCLPAGPLREPKKRLSEVDFIVWNGCNNKNKKMVDMNLIPGNFTQVKNADCKVTIDYFKDKIIHAVAGIGNPLRFFNLLRSLGLTINEHVYSDHYEFQRADFDFATADSIILMTEKDAVKCEKFADERFWYLPVQANVPPVFGKQILSRLVIIYPQFEGDPSQKRSG